MDGITVFRNQEFGKIRTAEENGKVLFSGSDVAKALGYSNDRDAINRHCKGVVKRDTLTAGGRQEITFITEGDVYRLITHSKLPAAEEFEHWVFDEVLPTIRKDGYYITEAFMSNPDNWIDALTAFKKERDRANRLQARLDKVLHYPDEREHGKRMELLEEKNAAICNDVIRALFQMLEDGEVRVVPLDGSGKPEVLDGNMIGFMDDRYLFAMPERLYRRVTEHWKNGGEIFPLTKRKLFQGLKGNGLIESDPMGRSAKVKNVGGKSMRFLWLPKIVITKEDVKC